jgi:hypothetical protein
MPKLCCLFAFLLVLSTHIVFSEEKEDGLLQDGAFASNQQYEYRLLATSKTSTMQKEMAEAGRAGFRIAGVMGGETAFGGSEVVVVMSRDRENPNEGDYQYKLLATSKTSTMQKELQEAGDEGFEYRGQTVFKTKFGGQEVVLILERDSNHPSSHQYKLLATSKTSTMQKELSEAGDTGFEFVGFTVGNTRFGGAELVAILRRQASR